MKIVLLDRATLGEDLDVSPFCEFGEVVEYASTDAAEVAVRIADADVVVINKVKLFPETVGAAEKLKLVLIAATGFDNVDLEFMRSRGVAVCNVSGYSTDSVAQVTVSMALSLATHLPEYNQSVESGEYSRGTSANRLTPVFHELAGKTWGVLGLGNIGKKVAAVASALGCRVIACKRVPDPEFECVDIDTLCKKADVISIHTPLTADTKNLISKERIEKMKKGTIVINVARGAVCDEAALCEAVKRGHLGGIGVDVYTKEPVPTDSPYTDVLDLENVCLTPHMAWGSFEARERLLFDMIESLKAFINGEKRSRLV